MDPSHWFQEWGIKVRNQTPYATKITLRAQVAFADSPKGTWSRGGEQVVVFPENCAITKTGSAKESKPWSQVMVTILYFETPGSRSCILDS